MNLSIMAPNHHFILNALPMEPVSRTYQYRKIMKPMLERKRRARINKCLDELKDLMTGTLQADGENVSKLEKADILELTVRHLHRLREHNSLFLTHSSIMQHGSNHNNKLSIEKFWAGFQHCAAEVSQFLNKYDRNISGELVKHIASYMPNIMKPTAAATAQQQRVAAREATSAIYQRCASAAIAGNTLGPMRSNCPPREGYFRVKLEPYSKKRNTPELDGVWRPW